MISVPSVYDLPASIAVTMENLDAVHDIRIGDVEATLHMPRRLPPSSPFPAIYPAAVADVVAINSKFNHPFHWGLPDPNGSGSWTFLMLVGIELRHADPAAIIEPSGMQDVEWGEISYEQRLRLRALSQIDDWFDLLRTWVEVQTKQYLDHKSHASPVQYPGETFSSYIEGEWVAKETVRVGDLSRNPATPEQLKLALDRAGALAEPPLEHVLARDARATFARRDLRRSAVDIGTATEVVLNRVYVATVSADRWSRLSQDRRNLGSLKSALNELGISFDDALDLVIDVRNGATHEGREPSDEDLESCLEFMEELIAEHGQRY